MSWIEILMCITGMTVLYKILKDNYDEKFGRKK